MHGLAQGGDRAAGPARPGCFTPPLHTQCIGRLRPCITNRALHRCSLSLRQQGHGTCFFSSAASRLASK